MRMILAGAAALALAATPAAAQDTNAANFDGPRAEARLGIETPNVSVDGDDNLYEIGTAASYGGEIGFDLAVGSSITLGAYANLEESSVSLEEDGDRLSFGASRQVGGRLGYAFSPNALGYVKIGYTDFELQLEDSTGRFEDRLSGAVFGLGLDYNLSKNVYAGIDIQGSHLEEIEGIQITRSQAAIRIGFRI